MKLQMDQRMLKQKKIYFHYLDFCYNLNISKLNKSNLKLPKVEQI